MKLSNLQDKLQALARKFFPEPILAEISDIDLSEYPEPLEINEEIQEKEIHEAIRYTTSNKALDLD